MAQTVPTATRDKTTEAGTDQPSTMTEKKAVGIIEFPALKLRDPPVLLEDRLRKMRGVTSVEINAFSKKVIVEFDPVITSLDKIRKILTTKSS